MTTKSIAFVHFLLREIQDCSNAGKMLGTRHSDVIDFPAVLLSSGFFVHEITATESKPMGFPFSSPTNPAVGSQAIKHSASCKPGPQPSFTMAFMTILEIDNLARLFWNSLAIRALASRSNWGLHEACDVLVDYLTLLWWFLINLLRLRSLFMCVCCVQLLVISQYWNHFLAFFLFFTAKQAKEIAPRGRISFRVYIILYKNRQIE